MSTQNRPSVINDMAMQLANACLVDYHEVVAAIEQLTTCSESARDAIKALGITLNLRTKKRTRQNAPWYRQGERPRHRSN